MDNIHAPQDIYEAFIILAITARMNPQRVPHLAKWFGARATSQQARDIFLIVFVAGTNGHLVVDRTLEILSYESTC